MSFLWRKRGFLLLFPVLWAVTVWQIRIENDLNTFFTATDNEDSQLLSGLLQSGELSRRYLLVVERSTSNVSDSQPEKQESLAGFSSRLVAQLANIQGVEQVWPAGQPPSTWLNTLAGYAPYHARLFSLNPAQDATVLFDPARLDARAQGLKQSLLAPQGGFVKIMAKQDPLLLSLNGFRGLTNRFQQNANPGALILQSQPAALDSQAHQSLQAAVRACFNSLNQDVGGQFKLTMAGIPVFSVAAHSEISRDVTLVSVVSSLSVMLVFLLLFRSFTALHWVMMLQTAAFAVGALVTALIFQQIHSLTLALGASLLGICTDYPIHVMVHAAKQGDPPLDSVKLLWPSLLMGGFTTVIGYLAMGMTGFPGFEQIAVFALFSITTSLGLTRWVLPALLNRQKLKVAHLPGIGAWVDFCAHRRKVLWGLFAVASILAVSLLPQLRWMTDMQKLAINMDALKQQDHAVRQHFSDIEPGRFVLIQSADMEGALRQSEAVERRLQVLKQAGALADYHGFFPWLVSQQLQVENARVYAQALTEPFVLAWKTALQRAQLSTEKLGRLLPASEAALLAEAVLETPVRHILTGQLLAGQNGVTLSIWLGEHDPQKLTQSLEGLAGVRYFSQKDQLDELAQRYRDKSLFMLMIGIVIMGIMIWIQQKELLKVLLTLFPALASVLFIFAIWALIGEELSFLHVIGLLLSVSLCIDYGIFFMENRGRDVDVTYHAIASSTLTTLASFGALGLGKTPTLPILALSVSVGVSLGFLLCPLLIPRRVAS